MSLSDDDRPRPRPSARPGENLADLSVDELQARIDLYREEIERLAREIATKERSRAAAHSFFKL